MEYTSQLRSSVLASVIATNDSFGVRTHIKVLVKAGEDVVSVISNNLIPFLRKELLMQIEDEQGNITDVYGDFIILSVGSKAAKILFKGQTEDECYVHFTVNQSPASARFYYGHMAVLGSPDIPMSRVELGLVFRGKVEDDNAPDTKSAERPKLTVVK